MNHNITGDRPYVWSKLPHEDTSTPIVLPRMNLVPAVSDLDFRNGIFVGTNHDMSRVFEMYLNREDPCVPWEDSGIAKSTEQGLMSPPWWGHPFMGDEP